MIQHYRHSHRLSMKDKMKVAIRMSKSEPVRMMRDVLSFGDEIANDTSDPAPKLMLADYLGEQGLPATSEAIIRGVNLDHPLDSAGDIARSSDYKWIASGRVGDKAHGFIRPHVCVFTGRDGYGGRIIHRVMIEASANLNHPDHPGILTRKDVATFHTTDHDLVERLIGEMADPSPLHGEVLDEINRDRLRHNKRMQRDDQPVKFMRELTQFGNMIESEPDDPSHKHRLADYLSDLGYHATAEAILRGNGQGKAGFDSNDVDKIHYAGNRIGGPVTTGRIGDEEYEWDRPLIMVSSGKHYSGDPHTMRHMIRVKVPSLRDVHDDDGRFMHSVHRYRIASEITTKDHDLAMRVIQELNPEMLNADRINHLAWIRNNVSKLASTVPAKMSMRSAMRRQ